MSARAVLSNTAIQVLGKLLTAVMSIIIIKVLAVYLGREGFGWYTTVYEFLAFFGIAADCGLFQIAVREMASKPKERVAIFKSILTLRLMLTLACMALACGAVWLIPTYTESPVALGVMVAAITTGLTIMHGTLSAALQAELKIHAAVAASVVGKVVALLWMLGIVFWVLPHSPSEGFFQLLVAGIVGTSVQLGITFWATRRIIPLGLSFDVPRMKYLLTAALPFGLAIILATVYFRIDVIFLSLLSGAESVGIYGIAMRVIENIQQLPIFFMNAMLPVVAASLALGVAGHIKARKYLQKSFDALALAAAPLVLGGTVLAWPLMSAMSSDQFLSAPGFVGADAVFAVLLVAMAFAFWGQCAFYSLLAISKPGNILIITTLAASLNVGLNLWAIPRFDVLGAAAASVVTEVVVVGVGLFFLWRGMRFIPRVVVAAKAVGAAAVMGAALLPIVNPLSEALGHGALAVLLPLGAAVYAAGIWALKAVSLEELKELIKKPKETHT